MSKKSLIITIVLVLLLLIAAVAGTFLMMRQLMPVAPVTAEGEVAAAPAPVTRASPVYKSLEPAFVVNIEDGRHLRFLQVQVEIMARSPAVVSRFETYEPRIRNDLIAYFSSFDREGLRDEALRAGMQARVLDIINQVLQEESGSAGVEAVYFTRFVIQ